MGSIIFVFDRLYGSATRVYVKHALRFPLCVPLDLLCMQLIAANDIPTIAHTDFFDDLKGFVESAKRNFAHAEYTRSLAAICDGSLNLHQLCGQFNESPFVGPTNYSTLTDDEIFGQAYHRVAHSALAKELIRLEQSLAVAVATDVDERDRVLQQLDDDVVVQTQAELEKRDHSVSATVNELQQAHIRRREFEEGQWNSRISELKRTQRQNFRDFVMSLDAQLACTNTLISKNSVAGDTDSNNDHGLSLSHPQKQTKKNSGTDYDPVRPPWSQSFTVQLGRQLRTTCNFRLIRADPMDSLRNSTLPSTLNELSTSSELNNSDLAERLSNAIGIYSRDLNGLILIVDKRVNSIRGTERRLAEVCERSTEFHFPELSNQLAAIQETIDHLGSRSDSSGPNPPPLTPVVSSQSRLSMPLDGDVYITKHSNLAGDIGGLAGGGGGISVIFHLVHDDTMNSRENDRIRTNSPLYSALSAILRTCFDYDVTTLTLPLLLVSGLREHMDMAWRARRAESVLKAFKGFLLEMSTWRGPTIRSIQFLAPPSLPDEELCGFSETIANSFLQPVPLIVS